MPAEPLTNHDALATEAASADERPDGVAGGAAAAAGDRRIVFFDGVCGMCNRTVDFIMARDRRRDFVFAPLQGETAAALLEAGEVQSLGSFVLLDHKGKHKRSTAIARVLWRLGGFWKFSGSVLWLIPWPLRDLGYRLVARFRYRLFGKKEACRLPTPEERARFLP